MPKRSAPSATIRSSRSGQQEDGTALFVPLTTARALVSEPGATNYWVKTTSPDHALVELGVLQAGDHAAGPALLVAEEEVARALIVLVDGLLDQSQAQDGAVEGSRPLHVAAQQRHVVKAGDSQATLVHGGRHCTCGGG